MQLEWVTRSELAKIVGIPESTTRRYLESFDAFFVYDSPGRGRRYKLSIASEVLARIQYLYQTESLSKEDIEDVLSKEFPRNINTEDLHVVEREESRQWISRGEMMEILAHYTETVTEALHRSEQQNAELREQMQKIQEEYHLAQNQVGAALEQRAKQFDEVLGHLREIRAEQTKPKKRWWNRR